MLHATISPSDPVRGISFPLYQASFLHTTKACFKGWLKRLLEPCKSCRDFKVLNPEAIFAPPNASLAQLVEHLPCKQRVAGSIPVGGSGFICIFAPAKTILDMAQTFFFTTCWRNSMSFAGRVMSEEPTRHHIERLSSRAERD